ncbi:kinase-like domain-containing protein [Rhizophagus clarus]|uniref:Kinase-like domain-containing protein n=1 Tax=Rhizophagus clarus TaxID=94130 RepID=A0A8H3QDD5_9GLOM|nr:kinase-like domain-containing protein [Rhizophagus clarus]
MAYSLNQSINAAINRAVALLGYNVYKDAPKQYEFVRQTILSDDLLTENEKPEAIRSLSESYDSYKIIINEGSKRICENCNQKCFGTLYLKIAEWIPYSNLQNIQYLTTGGCSEIYTADRIDGAYYKWDSKEKQLKRYGRQKVILKRLENIENANQSWFEEAKSHLILSNKWPYIVQCFGQRFVISDLGFCGPVDKPLTSIYGSLLYIAPEVIIGKQQTFKSDIYSVAMLMWEISSGQPPFFNYNHDYYLAMNIVNGIRPKIVPGTPLEYKNLMKRCWEADPLKRPDINTLLEEINLFHQNKSSELLTLPEKNSNLEIMSNISNCTSSTSKLYHFDNLSGQKMQQKYKRLSDQLYYIFIEFHSRLYNFCIPNNIVDFGKSGNRLNNTSKISVKFKDIQNEDKRVLIQQHVKNHHVNTDDEDEEYNNPNLHSEEQDDLELPDGN